MIERRASNNLSNDLLLQILDNQQKDSAVLHELKGDITVRVEKMERSQQLNWWTTYVVTPALMIFTALARHLGAKV